MKENPIVIHLHNRKPNCSGAHEIYLECGTEYEQTCDNILETDTKFCNPPRCVEGCFCKPNYVRNHLGECIRRRACPCHKDNEVFECGSACQTTCENYGQLCPIINVKCNDMCYCRPGYARNASNVCIPYEECPKKQPIEYV